MRIEPLFAPSLQSAPSGPRRTILPFAAGLSKPNPAVADTVPAVDPISRQRELSKAWPVAPKAQPPFTPRTAAAPGFTPRPANPKLEALRRQEIVTTANHGADLLRQVSSGELSASQAAAEFGVLAGQGVFSPKVSIALQSRFAQSLRRTLPQSTPRPRPAKATAPGASVDVGLTLEPASDQTATSPLRVSSQAEPLDRRLRPAAPEPDPVLQLQAGDPAVRSALEAYRTEPNQTNSFALSNALIEAQERNGVPQEQRTPVTTREAHEWAQAVIDTPQKERLRAIRNLAMRLQEIHGRHADLALKTISRHWAGDARATAYSDFLVKRLDTAAVVSDADAHAAAISGKFLGGPIRPIGIAPRNANRFATLQHTTAEVRDAEGNFIRGEPLGEAVTDDSGAVGFLIADGMARSINTAHHVVLFDPKTEGWWVFNRLFRNDGFVRPIVIPGPVENDRTGERSFGATETVDALAGALMLPGDVLSGLVLPESEDAIGRGIELAALPTTSTFVRRGAAQFARSQARARAVAEGRTGPRTMQHLGGHPSARHAASADPKAQSVVQNKGVFFERPPKAPDFYADATNIDKLFSGGTVGDRRQLRVNMLNDPSLGLKDVGGWEAHHATTWDLIDHEMIVRLGMNLNDSQAGIPLPDEVAGVLAVHKGSHPGYTAAMEVMLDRIEALAVPDQRKRVFVAALIDRTRQALFGGEVPLNQAKGGTKESWLKAFDRIADDIGLLQSR